MTRLRGGSLDKHANYNLLHRLLNPFNVLVAVLVIVFISSAVAAIIR